MAAILSKALPPTLSSAAMATVHRTLAMVLLVAAGAFTVGAIIAAARKGAGPWLEWLRRTLIALVAVEALAGLVLYASGQRPEESLHLLYGVAGLLVVPFGSYFAAAAPPRPRAAVLAVAGIVTLGIFFRSFVTG
jgi:FtsH-binding integral membrane protein